MQEFELYCDHCHEKCCQDGCDDDDDYGYDYGYDDGLDDGLDDGNPRPINRNAIESSSESEECDACINNCERVAQMEENGYIDATNFIYCQMIYDGRFKNEESLYAGPICKNTNAGSRVNIGVFRDEECFVYDPMESFENYLHDEKGNGLKLSHGILKKTYQNNFIDCRLDADGKEDEDELKSRLCFELHEAAIEHETEDPDGKIPMMTHWNGMYTYITFIQYTIIMHVQCYCISNHPQRRLND